MSDLQDLIATNAVRAYNEGFERGSVEERERIINLLKQNGNHYGCAWDCPQPCNAPSFLELIAQIKGERE